MSTTASSTKDKEEDALKSNFERIKNYMNTERRVSLLLISWLYDNLSESAMIEQITKDGVELRIKKGTNKNVKIRHKFQPPLLESKEVRDALMKLINEASYCQWPGYTGLISIMLQFFVILSVFDKQDFTNTTGFLLPIQKIQEISLSIFRNETIAISVLIFLILVHIGEAIYVVYLLKKASIDEKYHMSWILSTLMLGYPVTARAQLLEKVASKKQN